mgnify:CR=1 FL=1|nr:MAG TPA: hypothetical protein [Caudoviricetes sp.]
MLYWSIIIFICIIIFAISLKALKKSYWNSTFYFTSTLSTFIVAFFIGFAMLLTTCEYKSFLASFETQRTIITQMSQSHQFNYNTLIYVADIIDANQKLAEIQGSKKAWGGWSMYPDSVMDVVPIGLEN